MPSLQPQSTAPPAPRPSDFIRPAAGVYTHWPFCARKCPYCDFYTYGREHPRFALNPLYLDSLESEAAGLRERFNLPGRPAVDAVYLGGGTPSLMSPDELARLLGIVRKTFDPAPDLEVTLEVNPTAAEAELLGPARAMGVNRLSIGCQSFNDKFLRLLGRDHDAASADRALRLARATGYDNLSLDLMFGLPGQTLADFEADLDAALAFEPEHISAYGLTYHEGTPFDRWRREGKLKPPGDDHEADQLKLLIDKLAGAGFVHYEISNWALPGRESRHNSKYWSPADVFGLGASAHGVIRGRRYANPRNLEAYLGLNKDAPRLGEVDPPLDLRAAAGEATMLALRRIAGLPWTDLNAWLDDWIPQWRGRDAREFYVRELEDLAGRDWIDSPGGERLRLTEAGLPVADAVMAEFF